MVMDVSKRLKPYLKFYTQYVDKNKYTFIEWVLSDMIHEPYDSFFLIESNVKLLIELLLHAEKERKLKNEKENLCDL